LTRARPNRADVALGGAQRRVDELAAETAHIEAEATRRAIADTAITKSKIVMELWRIGSANMMDFMTVGPDGDPVTNFKDLTRDQTAALQEIVIDAYVEGHGKEARQIKKVKFKLGDKGAALMNIARLFGWIIEKQERKVVDDLEGLTIEELEAIAEGRDPKALSLNSSGGGGHPGGGSKSEGAVTRCGIRATG